MLSLTYEGWILAGAPKHGFNYKYSKQCFFFFFPLLLCLYIQMPVAGCDHLPCCATMLRRPLPFCAGQLHHGNLYGCWSAANWLVMKVMCCNAYSREHESMHTSQQFAALFSSKRGWGQGWRVPRSAVQERGREGRPGADEVVRVVSLLQTSALLALQRLRPLRRG